MIRVNDTKFGRNCIAPPPFFGWYAYGVSEDSNFQQMRSDLE